MPAIRDARLVLFMTRGGSLSGWHANGSFSREVALYRKLQPHLSEVVFVTYGDSGDAAYSAQLGGARVVCNRWNLPGPAYRWLIQNREPTRWGGLTIVKSNQVAGAEVALAAARRARRPFVARCGYLPSFFSEQLHGSAAPEAVQAAALERRVFRQADRVVVSTEGMRQHVVERHDVPENHVRVIPNYVQTDVFRPGPGRGPTGRVGFAGRLEHQKNPLVLVDAVEGLDVRLEIVGSGSLREAMEKRAHQRGVAVRFHGTVPNHQLPSIIQQWDVFLFPSRFEGHPKGIAEAMACGVPVIGSNVPGIQDLVQHERTGLLAEPTGAAFNAALRRLLEDQAFARSLGVNARRFIENELTLERVVKLELDLLREIVET